MMLLTATKQVLAFIHFATEYGVPAADGGDKEKSRGLVRAVDRVCAQIAAVTGPLPELTDEAGPWDAVAPGGEPVTLRIEDADLAHVKRCFEGLNAAAFRVRKTPAASRAVRAAYLGAEDALAAAKREETPAPAASAAPAA